MFCPQCASEFREGFTRCSDCDVDLVPELPSEEEPSDLVRIFQTNDVALIAALKSELEQSGIGFETRNEALQDLIGGGRLAGFNPILGPVEFWVREENESAARELVRQLEESSAEPLDAGEEATDADVPARYSRRFRRIVAAGALNLVLLPLSAFSTYVVLHGTRWGQLDEAAAGTVAQAVAGGIFIVMCVLWAILPKIAAWTQAIHAVPMIWIFFAGQLPDWKALSFEENGLLVIGTVFALAGAVLIALAFAPRVRATR